MTDGCSAGSEPHLDRQVTSATKAQAIVKSATFGENGRGYSATNRAGEYGHRSMVAHLEAPQHPVIVLQTGNPQAVGNIDEIVAITGISALFVGPADFAVAYG